MELRELIEDIKVFLYQNLHIPNSDYFHGKFAVFPGIELVDNYEVVGRGNTRLVIKRPNSNWVIKLPIREKGKEDNEMEYFLFKSGTRPAVQKAKCKLVYIKELPLLLMEFVIPIDSDFPQWAFQVDNKQVGKNRNGRIVAYDYAWLQR